MCCIEQIYVLYCTDIYAVLNRYYKTFLLYLFLWFCGEKLKVISLRPVEKYVLLYAEFYENRNFWNSTT